MNLEAGRSIFMTNNKKSALKTCLSKIGKNFGKEELQKHLFLFTIFLIPMAAFFVFWLYVNLQSILNAFRVESNGEVIWSFINWKYFWEDLTRSGSMVDMALILRNTLIFFFNNSCIFFIFALLVVAIIVLLSLF